MIDKYKTTLEIIAEYLKANNYDGLYSECGCDGCACEIDDLAPCGESSLGCNPGYKQPCDCGDHDFHIGISSAEDIHDAKVIEEALADPETLTWEQAHGND